MVMRMLSETHSYLHQQKLCLHKVSSKEPRLSTRPSHGDGLVPRSYKEPTPSLSRRY